MSFLFSYAAIVTAALALAAPGVHAQEFPPPEPDVTAPAAVPTRPVVRGWQLMTDEERTHYRATMRSLETPEDREQLRKAIHEAMKIRATQRGLTLPDEPPARGGRRQPSGDANENPC
jgi:hypothetical protein